MRSAHGVPVFICAPQKTGRSSLALDYARRCHQLSEVLWVEGSSDGFREAIRSGTLPEHLERQRASGLNRFSLIVFDNLPPLGERVAARFSDWMDRLIEDGVEVIVITTPSDDCLASHQSDRLLIDGARLVASQRWSAKRRAEVLGCLFDSPLPRELVTLAALMTLMGRGSVDDLRGLGYPIPATTPALLKAHCPLIDIDEHTGAFDASGFSVMSLRRPLLALLDKAVCKDDEDAAEVERCFERLTRLSVFLFERSQREQSQLLLELAGSLLTHDDAGFPLAPPEYASEPPGGCADEPAADGNAAPPAAREPFTVLQGGLAHSAEQENRGAHHPVRPRAGRCAVQVAERAEPLVVRLFGDFELLRGGRRIEGENLRRSKVRALMAHLALNMGCGIARDTLMERLWPGKEPALAKGNFHATWSRLNQLLAGGAKPSPYLTNNRGLCRLEPSSVTADVSEFEQLSKAFLFEQGSAEQRIEAIYRLERIYRGDILAGCQIDPYIQAAQQRYRSILVDVMLEASKLFSQEGNDTNAVWFARRAYDTDPSREDVYRILMAMQDRAGQRTNALKTYFDCRRFLSEELGILPSQKTTALYQELILDRR
jgi:DNA-binding SARP family transcriptional activator